MTEIGAALVNTALQNVPWPSFVKAHPHEVGSDATGDPAVWVWVVVDDATPESTWSDGSLAKLTDQIRQALAGLNVWPYVHFRSESEEAEVAAYARRA